MINRLVFENLKHRPIRTLLTIAAIGLQVTMILTLVGLSRGTIEGSIKRTRGTGADVLVRPPNSAAIGLSGAPIPEKILDLVRKQPHVAIATGVVMHQSNMFDTIAGVDMPTFVRMSGGLDFISGGPFKNPHEVIIDEYYAQQRKLKAGDTTKLLNNDYKVTGVFQSGKGARTMIDIKELQEAVSATNKLTMIYVKADNPKNAQAIVDELKAPEMLPDYSIFTMEEFLSQISADSVPLLKSFTKVIIGLSVVFGFLVVFLAMYTAVLERTREIGILKALGASPPFIVTMLVRETAMLALAGAIFGILLTYFTRWVIMASYPASLTQAIVPDWWPIAGGIALGGACVGALYPGMKAARQDAIEALTYE